MASAEPCSLLLDDALVVVQFAFVVLDAPQDNIGGRQIRGRARIQSGIERTRDRICFGKKGRLESGRNDQNAEEECGIEFLDFELTLGTRPGALAAIRITRRSEKADAEFGPGGVNENRCVGDGLAIFVFDHAAEVRAFRVGVGVTRRD